MIIFITGMIGSGKSTVLNLVSGKGYKTIDLDKEVHSLYEKKKSCYKVLTEYFGDIVLTKDKERIDRTKLKALIMLKKKYAKKVDSLLQPLIYEHLKNLISDLPKNEKIFVEASRFWQNEEIYKNLADKIVEVKAKMRTIVMAAREKYEFTENKGIKYVEKLKKYHKKRAKHVDFYVENYGTKEQLLKEVEKLLMNI